MKRRMVLVASVLLGSLLALNSAYASGSSEGASSAGPVTISFTQPGLDQPNTKKPVEALVSRFEAKNPSIKIKLIAVGWDTAYQKLVNAFESGDAPDVLYGGTRWMSSFAAMKGIQSLDSYAQNKIKDYFPALQDAVKYKGQIYALPRAYSARALIYRSDLIKNPPTTWGELVSVAQRVQKDHPGIYGFGIAGAKHVSTTTQLFNYIFQNGGGVFSADGTDLLNSPADVQALQFYADLYTKYKIVPNPIEYNREQLPNLFKEGKIAMFVCGPWAKALIGAPPDNGKTPYKTALLPKGTIMSNTLVSDSIMMSADAPNTEAAWKFMDYITSLPEQTKYDKAAGLLPIQTKEASDPYYTNDAYIAPFVKMAAQGQPQPKPASWEPFQNIITNAVQSALSGDAPQSVMDKAVQQIADQQLMVK